MAFAASARTEESASDKRGVMPKTSDGRSNLPSARTARRRMNGSADCTPRTRGSRERMSSARESSAAMIAAQSAVSRAGGAPTCARSVEVEMRRTRVAKNQNRGGVEFMTKSTPPREERLRTAHVLPPLAPILSQLPPGCLGIRPRDRKELIQQCPLSGHCVGAAGGHTGLDLPQLGNDFPLTPFTVN